MRPIAYRAGCLAAQYLLGLEKTATAAELTTVGKGLEKLKELKRFIPESTLGKGTALGGLTGVGLGTHMLMSDNHHPGTVMETPYVVPQGNPLLYEQQY